MVTALWRDEFPLWPAKGLPGNPLAIRAPTAWMNLLFDALLFPEKGIRYSGSDCKFMKVMFGLFNLGGGEIILILALVLILFGAKKLPELAKGLGTGIKEFKKATRDVTDEMHSAMEEPPPPPPKSLPPAAPQPEAQPTVPQSTPENKA